MTRFIQLLLVVAILGLLVYPIWGAINPESIRAELAEHYSYDASATANDLSNASYWLLLPNGLLALAIAVLTIYLSNPTEVALAYFAAVFFALTPIAKIYASAEMGYLLTSQTEMPIYAIEVSSEGLVYWLVAIIVVAMARVKRTV